MARDPKKIHFQIICGKFDVMELDPTTYCLEKLRGFNLNGEENIESLKAKKKVRLIWVVWNKIVVMPISSQPKHTNLKPYPLYKLMLVNFKL
jgi:hypothetical protein